MRIALVLLVLAACAPERAEPAAPSPAPAQARAPDLPRLAYSNRATPAVETPVPPAAPAFSLDPSPDELLVLRAPTEPHWRGLRRSLTAPEYVACELATPDDLAHLDLVRGEIRLSPRTAPHPVAHTCELVRVDRRFARSEHPIRPLAADHLGELILGLSAAEQASWLTHPDLERAPQRGFVGQESGHVVFASAWLEDLGDPFAVPGRPLLARADLERDLEARRASGARVARLGGARHFAPQVADARERLAFARVPVLSVTAASQPYQDEGLMAVVLQVAGQPRYLLYQRAPMRSSWEAALRRGRVIERIVEDGARPRE
ncbi:hypothetical protein SAMN02745121_03813 [Nannocystis exedens]|uniref:Uncharacterized protein n=1 Tax=Nannocystis exedens TaxID=54 RepID=A0A1I1ZJR8_9BACT|nr:hypothetical protein [Nannocystis exedens]PCC75461.1 hypothetical protein NAEX_08571 [Nannocystis exedens]SFE31956.1 hypothetical protein SAMN02745121_03813 [Nannocystis exedens]